MDIGPPNVFNFLINVTHVYRVFSTFVYAVFSTLMVCKAKFYIFDHSFTFSSLRNDRKMDKKMCRALGKSRARGDQNHIYFFTLLNGWGQ